MILSQHTVTVMATELHGSNFMHALANSCATDCDDGIPNSLWSKTIAPWGFLLGCRMPLQARTVSIEPGCDVYIDV